MTETMALFTTMTIAVVETETEAASNGDTTSKEIIPMMEDTTVVNDVITTTTTMSAETEIMAILATMIISIVVAIITITMDQAMETTMAVETGTTSVVMMDMAMMIQI